MSETTLSTGVIVTAQLHTDIVAEAARMIARMSAPHVMWSKADIAMYMNCGTRQAQDWLNAPSFPRAHRVLGTGHPRWDAAEVREWAGKWKDKN